MTSVAADNSTVGFMLINTRTKETTFYPLSGATEGAAMGSAQGIVQDLGYKATYPIIINLNNQPTYFMTLKDESGLVKQYAFVNVENYSIVGAGTTLLAAQNAYNKALYQQGEIKISAGEETSLTGTVERIGAEVVDGDTFYTFIISGTPVIFSAPYTLSSKLSLTKLGDTVEIKYFDNGDGIITIQEFNNLTVQ